MRVRFVTVGPRYRTAAVVAAIAVAAACSPGRGSQQPPQNLLLITLDTLRADHLGFHGYHRDTSPALDGFAAQSTVFSDVTCSMPTTLPSHITIFTGQPPAVHGVTRNGMVPQRDLETFFDEFSRRGVRTAAIVSAGVVQNRFLGGRGIVQKTIDRPAQTVFQVPGSVVSDNALRWLDRHGEQPFALWLHYFDTHEPYDPPTEFARRFTDSYSGTLSDELDTDWLVSLNRPEIDASLTEADRRHIVDVYDAEIAFLDQQLSRVFKKLNADGLLDNTLVVIVSDHGQAHGENGFWGHGERLLEPVIKLSLVIREPGQKIGRVVDAAVESLDVMPTVADYFGFEISDEISGRSLAGAVRGEAIRPAQRRIVVRRSYPDTPDRFGMVFHRVGSKGTYYREPEGPIFHIGRVDGRGGLDGEDFFVFGSESSAWFEEFVAELSPPSAGDSENLTEQDLEMLRALGYTQ